MNFPLKQLENHLRESWLLAGETWYEAGAVSSLTEVERHLWTARVDACEVEIHISPSRVREMTCECEVFRREKGCGHIAAALLALRRHLSAEKPAPEKAPAREKTSRVTIPGLLDQVLPEELAEFVRDYARQNRAFALALKARFTGALNIPMENKREKIMELLDATINSVRTKDDQLSFRGSQQLVQVVRELLSQADEAIAHHSLPDAMLLVTAVLEKIGPVSRKTKTKGHKLDDTLHQAFRQVEQLLPLRPAPGLLLDLWDFARTESRKSLYRRSALQLEYFRLLLALAPELGKIPELLDLFRQQLEDTEPNDPNRRELLIYIYQLLARSGDTPGLEAHLINHFNDPGLILYVVEEALKNGQWKKARFLAEKGLEHAQASAQAEKLEEHILQLALRDGDREAILQFATARFLETRNPDYLSHLRQYAANDWPQIVDDLIEKLEQRPWSTGKRDAIARLLFEDERFDSLFQYIQRLQSIDLLQRYGPSWPDAQNEQAETLYREVLHNYLLNHLGRKPSQRVRELLEQLIEAGKGALADRLLNGFRSEFAERQSLMEELEALPI